MVGFAYGYANTPDQYWHTEVAKVAPPHIVSNWLMNSFRLVEMAVAPRAQGGGIGGALHYHLLNGLQYPKAVLSTMAADTAAYRMYKKRGWVVLIDDMVFSSVARADCIRG
ncbi:MAG: GNAT family N-acetyltransferase, partial [Anaerolineaceae bacterium]|nr:GNAT family N-acetyltransferase [Anaerolineaceae bacterium]